MIKSSLLIALLLISCTTKQNPAEKLSSNREINYQFKKQGILIFYSSNRDSITQINIEIAENEKDQQMGLMFRNSMSDSIGMLFIFQSQELRNFWMKNTYLSLDIIFVNSQNEIVKIQSNTEPLTEDLYPSERPAQFVVEVNSGFTEKFKIQEGDRIQFRKY